MFIRRVMVKPKKYRWAIVRKNKAFFINPFSKLKRRR